MTNSEIYRRTLKFALMRLLCTIIGIIVVIGLPVGAFIAAAGASEGIAAIAAGAGLIVGIIVFVLIARYAGYLFTAGQIAMIAEGVSSGDLPEDTYAAGKRAVKERFATASVYFVLMGITKAISSEITMGINAVTSAIEGGAKAGPASTVGSVVSTVISVVLEYLNYCSLGWVFLHKDQSAFKSTCDGAVIYFQNWKVLLKNAAKVIGFTLVSLVVIGGVFFGASYLILGAIGPLQGVLADIDASLVLDDGTAAPAGTTLVVLSIVVALLFWSGLHGAFVQPYILVSVMRRYIEAGQANPPKVDLYGKLAGMSKSFRKALDKAQPDSTGAAA